jgi:hypothetical protein
MNIPTPVENHSTELTIHNMMKGKSSNTKTNKKPQIRERKKIFRQEVVVRWVDISGIV